MQIAWIEWDLNKLLNNIPMSWQNVTILYAKEPPVLV
jgi:hypothetical protein